MSKANWTKRMCGVLLLLAAAAIATHAQAPTVAPAMTFRVLHTFDLTDGNGPIGELVQGTGGKLYGVTQSSGANNYGTVFKITQAAS